MNILRWRWRGFAPENITWFYPSFRDDWQITIEVRKWFSDIFIHGLIAHTITLSKRITLREALIDWYGYWLLLAFHCVIGVKNRFLRLIIYFNQFSNCSLKSHGFSLIFIFWLFYVIFIEWLLNLWDFFWVDGQFKCRQTIALLAFTCVCCVQDLSRLVKILFKLIWLLCLIFINYIHNFRCRFQFMTH